MAMAIVILSNEGGKDRALIVSASREEARAVAGIARRCTGSRYLGIETKEALSSISDAVALMGGKWEKAHRSA